MSVKFEFSILFYFYYFNKNFNKITCSFTPTSILVLPRPSHVNRTLNNNK